MTHQKKKNQKREQEAQDQAQEKEKQIIKMPTIKNKNNSANEKYNFIKNME